MTDLFLSVSLFNGIQTSICLWFRLNSSKKILTLLHKTRLYGIHSISTETKGLLKSLTESVVIVKVTLGNRWIGDTLFMSSWKIIVFSWRSVWCNTAPACVAEMLLRGWDVDRTQVPQGEVLSPIGTKHWYRGKSVREGKGVKSNCQQLLCLVDIHTSIQTVGTQTLTHTHTQIPKASTLLVMNSYLWL